MQIRRQSKRFMSSRHFSLTLVVGILSITGVAYAALIDMTMEDFYLSGTQVLDVRTDTIFLSNDCIPCHGPFVDEVFAGRDAEPITTWWGSLMGQAGRDPLFFAQMATANEDVGNVGNFCMRCHVPMTWITGHANETDGSTIDEFDRDGVNCHFCHTLIDPIYKEGISPLQDKAFLEDMDDVPEYYGNAMFVIDPTGTRRGPRRDAGVMHDVIYSPFHKTGEFCGTCHDVGNVAVTKGFDGTYRYNTIDKRTPDEDLWAQFPLERTYTEWKLSEFADGGVDMGGRFGGFGPPVVSTCQDCHMPKTYGKACYFGPQRHDLRKHDFSGSAAWVLEIIALYYEGNTEVDHEALEAGQQKAISMLQRAASLELGQSGDFIQVRVINETGHKLPTGHIEGRRVFINVQFMNEAGEVIDEYGHYDYETAHLDAESTRVYEMHVGLSDYAANATGLPPGVTSHMALADTIEKDNRIPPRGFNNAAFEEGGAPIVGYEYADGQYWDDVEYEIPAGAYSAKVAIYYQIVTRHYIETLQENNHSNHWGDTLMGLWKQTDMAAPIEMVSDTIVFE